MIFLRFLFLAALKGLGRTFYTYRYEWVGERKSRPFHDIRLAILLNHTSLFEPLFSGVVPLSWLREIAERAVLPGADLTMNRPIVGRLFKAMVPNPVTITRRRDGTWKEFMSKIKKDSLVFLFPEGRMKRPSGMDKNGKPMTVRPGIAEVLNHLDEGNMLIIYSGGLHHIQSPGQGFPNLFKKLSFRFEAIPIRQYKESMGHGAKGFTKNVVSDLEKRRDVHCKWD